MNIDIDSASLKSFEFVYKITKSLNEIEKFSHLLGIRTQPTVIKLDQLDKNQDCINLARKFNDYLLSDDKKSFEQKLLAIESAVNDFCEQLNSEIMLKSQNSLAEYANKIKDHTRYYYSRINIPRYYNAPKEWTLENLEYKSYGAICDLLATEIINKANENIKMQDKFISNMTKKPDQTANPFLAPKHNLGSLDNSDIPIPLNQSNLKKRLSELSEHNEEDIKKLMKK